jgi:hypothetical protein
MPIELRVPEVGESISEVQIGDWLKQVGDLVERDEPLVVIEGGCRKLFCARVPTQKSATWWGG